MLKYISLLISLLIVNVGCQTLPEETNEIKENNMQCDCPMLPEIWTPPVTNCAEALKDPLKNYQWLDTDSMILYNNISSLVETISKKSAGGPVYSAVQNNLISDKFLKDNVWYGCDGSVPEIEFLCEDLITKIDLCHQDNK